jgi:hypothetical protein
VIEITQKSRDFSFLSATFCEMTINQRVNSRPVRINQINPFSECFNLPLNDLSPAFQRFDDTLTMHACLTIPSKNPDADGDLPRSNTSAWSSSQTCWLSRYKILFILVNSCLIISVSWTGSIHNTQESRDCPNAQDYTSVHVYRFRTRHGTLSCILRFSLSIISVNTLCKSLVPVLCMIFLC